MIDILSGIAFVVMIVAPVAAVMALYGRPESFAKPAETRSETLPFKTIEKRMDESRTTRSRYLRSLLRPAA